jgi:hypothetical protein
LDSPRKNIGKLVSRKEELEGKYHRHMLKPWFWNGELDMIKNLKDFL